MIKYIVSFLIWMIGEGKIDLFVVQEWELIKCWCFIRFSILSLFKAVKVVGTTTTILEPFKEYVHIASIIMQAVYKEMATMTGKNL